MLEWREAPLLEGDPPGEPCFPAFERDELRRLATEKCGIIRSGEELQRALELLASRPMIRRAEPRRSLYELRSIHTVIRLIALCALARQESRGAHYRIDFPEKRPEYQKHSVVCRGGQVRFV
jgi:L-aspartate oxidase